MYDRRGRLVRSVTSREPEWTELDVAEMQALAEYRASLCPCGCGHPYADTTSHEDAGPQFVAHRIRCRARDTLLAAQADLKNTQNPGALLWRTERR